MSSWGVWLVLTFLVGSLYAPIELLKLIVLYSVEYKFYHSFWGEAALVLLGLVAQLWAIYLIGHYRLWECR